MKSIKLAFALTVVLLSSSATAATLDFEGFVLGEIINAQYFDEFGVTISATGVGSAPDYAVVFDSKNPTGGDDDLAAPFAPGAGNPFGSLSPGNLLILQEHDNCANGVCPNPDDQGARPAGTIHFDFLSPVLIGTLDFFDIEGPETGDVVLYGSGDVVLATFAIPSTGGDNLWQRLVMNVSGVAAIDVNMGGSGAIDNLTFSAVPLPGALLLMLGALGPLGFFGRRKG